MIPTLRIATLAVAFFSYVSLANAGPNHVQRATGNTCTALGCFSQPGSINTTGKPRRELVAKRRVEPVSMSGSEQALAFANGYYQTPVVQKGQIRTHDLPPKSGVSLACIVGPLKAKAEEIIAACGSKVVSAFRRGARIPTGQQSNHAICRAVDLAGSPDCIYAHLRGWPGGYSTDYHTAPGTKHVHISYNPNMEWGMRFVHYHSHKRHRVASR